jgi:two-component system chemotaxis sensor kinase CheA
MSISTELTEQIEGLALKTVVAEGPCDSEEQLREWITALCRLQDTATRTNASEVADSAASVIEAVRSSPADRVMSELQAGISRLQEAVEAEERTAVSNDHRPALDPELLGDFVLESQEHLAGIEAQALILERNPADAEALNSVFRGFHTIKGLAGFLELWEVQRISHEVETVLDLARNAQVTITSTSVDLVLKSADYLRKWLAHVAAGLSGEASEPPPPDELLISDIRALASNGALEETASSQIASLADAILREPVPERQVVPATSPVTPEVPGPVARSRETMAVKVDTGKLDFLADMAGELVIAESLVRHDADLAGIQSQTLQRKISMLTRITAELQKTAMAMRLVPIGPLFSRMARLVRDLSRQFGKSVELETFGAEIELDRTIVDELADPFMHMVRNALDHGIEPSGERRAAGKNPTAKLSLKAHHQSGQVVIEVGDDGRGLDRERILAKAVERGLVEADRAVSDSEVYNLIFEPGFTTAARLTNVSGRGVGMDVVRRHIEKLRGRIEIRSTPGQGAAFVLKLPLTLAIIDGLIVGVGRERYVVPVFAVREMFRPTAENVWTVQNRAEMVLVRGSLLPLTRLSQRFGVPPRSQNALESVVIVTEVEGKRFCLLVDELVGKQEVVIKALGETFNGVGGVAGGTILGDGRVALILDLDRLFQEKTVDPAR